MALSPDDPIVPTTVGDRQFYTLVEDEPHYCLWGLVELDRPLPEDLLVAATRRLLERIPILCARPKFRWWRGYWAYQDPGDVRQLITRRQAGTPDELETFRREAVKITIDPAHPPLFRVTALDSPTQHHLVLQVHHCVVDGDGASRVFAEFARCCREVVASANPLPPPAPLDMNRSWRQITRYLPWWRILVAPLYRVRAAIALLFSDLRGGRTARLVTDRPERMDIKRPDKPAFETLLIPADTIATARQDAPVSDTTVNDALMAALMATTCQWNLERGERFTRLRAAYTGNLRRWWGEPPGPFANMSCIRVLESHRRQLTDSRHALQALKPALDRAKRSMGLSLLGGMLEVIWHPEALLRWFTRRFKPVIRALVVRTAALTNIGPLSAQAGDFGVAHARSYSILGPCHPGPAVLFTASGFGGDLTVHLGYDAACLDPSSAQAFLSRLDQSFRDLAAKK